MNKKTDLILQLTANLIPLIGFWFFNWNMFAIIYLYWSEGLIIAIFNSAKVAIAGGEEPNGHLTLSFGKRLVSSFKLLIFRFGMMFFYLIFIFAFVAFPGGESNREVLIQNGMVMWFKDPLFNNALLICFISQCILFFSAFIATNDYKDKPSSEYKVIFDTRTIVLHIVIVLGTFAYQFLQKYESVSNKLPALSYVLILVLLKSFADIFHYKQAGHIQFKN